jgi:NAD(P)-dependent dehydrogenase (short-subunit alcohol dehydrogenase family)
MEAQDRVDFDLSGKTALVTGASRGIGLAIAQALAAAGARVVLSSRKQDALEQAAEGIRLAGGQALAIAAHTGDAGAVQQLVQRVLAEWGGVDILVNNAGTNPVFGTLLSVEDSMWEKILQVNLLGYVRTIRACVESMTSRGGGKIINIASITGLEAQAWLGVYGVSKAAVLMLTRVLALELAQDNIQVNAIAPGLIKTHFSQVLWDTPEIAQEVLKRIPQERFGTPEEVAGLALYLASPASSYTTGAVFVVDGGETSGRRLW